MIELYLSSDGKHTIHAQTDSKDEMDKLLPYAKELYQKIVEELGTKAQMWTEAFNGNHKSPPQGSLETAPICPVHHKLMKKRAGQFGSFWSCGTKLDTGNWCSYRPDKDKESGKELNNGRSLTNGLL